MKYRFAIDNHSYEDFASGRVLISAPGFTAFPVRLAREMFEQSVDFREFPFKDLTLYDPCCGAGYLVTVIGFLYGDLLDTIIASDINDAAVSLAFKNLSLLSPDGLRTRISELRHELRVHERESYVEAIGSARRLQTRLGEVDTEVSTFVANALSASSIKNGLKDHSPGIVISDLPYGRSTAWLNSNGTRMESSEAIRLLLDNLLHVIRRNCIVALCTPGDKVDHPSYDRLRQVKIGRRRITWLSVANT